MAIILSKLSNLFFGILTLSTLAVHFENYTWVGSLIANFRFWLVVLGLFLVVVYLTLAREKRWMAALSLLIVAYHVWGVFPFFYGFLGAAQPEANGVQGLSVLYSNLNSQNEKKNLLIHHLKTESPDFVLLVETNRSWFEELRALSVQYPYAKGILKENNFGMTILSRVPLELKNHYFDRENLVPALWVEAETRQGKIGLFLMHPHPPLGSYATMARDQYLLTLGKHLSETSTPILVCGDFNATPWLKVFRKFILVSGLEFPNSTALFNTWWATKLLPGLPIDHCLLKGLKISRYELGPELGSDHRPIRLSFSL